MSMKNLPSGGIGFRLPSASGQAGFGIIEVLIAVLVLAIGLLGMAALQTNGIQMTTGALSRTQAVFLAEDIIERARANRADVDDYTTALAIVNSQDPDFVGCDSAYSFDNSETIPSEDVAEWQNSVLCLLPGGNSSVVVNGNVMTVTVTWDARSGEASDGEIEVEAEI